MTTYYVGPGGSDSNDGLSWSGRKLTLNGVEDIPVSAGDIVYVGPGIYREQLTCDVSGSSGNLITYIGDLTGVNTDGIGGIVRITGTDNEQTVARNYCIISNGTDYRKFVSLFLDEATTALMDIASSDSWIVEDCVFSAHNSGWPNRGIYYRPDANNLLLEVRRCIFHTTSNGIVISAAGDYYTNPSSIIENCIIDNIYYFDIDGIYVDVEGIVIRNCFFWGRGTHIRSGFNTVSSGESYVYNSIFCPAQVGIEADGGTGVIVEDYNTFTQIFIHTDFTDGANSDDSLNVREFPMLLSGMIFPHDALAPSIWDYSRRITGTNEASDDLYGFDRPVTAGKKSRGAIQFRPGIRTEIGNRETITAIELDDAGIYLIFVPVVPVSTTISVWVLRQKDYAGTLPQMIIVEPGQSDRVTTDVGSAKVYNLLTDTFTPSGATDYVLVILKTNNTASSGKYATRFADFDVNA